MLRIQRRFFHKFQFPHIETTHDHNQTVKGYYKKFIIIMSKAFMIRKSIWQVYIGRKFQIHLTVKVICTINLHSSAGALRKLRPTHLGLNCDKWGNRVDLKIKFYDFSEVTEIWWEQKYFYSFLTRKNVKLKIFRKKFIQF